MRCSFQCLWEPFRREVPLCCRSVYFSCLFIYYIGQMRKDFNSHHHELNIALLNITQRFLREIRLMRPAVHPGVKSWQECLPRRKCDVRVHMTCVPSQKRPLASDHTIFTVCQMELVQLETQYSSTGRGYCIPNCLPKMSRLSVGTPQDNAVSEA